MSEFRNQNVYDTDASGALNSYLVKVFTKMGMGLFITAITAFAVYTNIVRGGFMLTVVSSPISFVLLIAQFVVCIGLGAGLTKFSTQTANILFYVYAVITGINFSTLLITYSIGTVFAAFGFTAVMFFSCAVIGHTTKVDLSKFTSLIFGALIALVLCTVLSLFIPVLRDSLFLSYAGIILFLVLTAWDMQKIKACYYQTLGNDQLQGNFAVYGAFQLYLDFINIFLYVLRILARNNRRD